MLKQLFFHDIVSIRVTETKHFETSFGKRNARNIVIKDENGEEFTFQIFSKIDDLNVKIPKPEQAPDFIGMLDELTIRA
jgi:hypothetical protein